LQPVQFVSRLEIPGVTESAGLAEAVTVPIAPHPDRAGTTQASIKAKRAAVSRPRAVTVAAAVGRIALGIEAGTKIGLAAAHT
jgi:hypothetical protein